jgi:hypothetical protein
VRIQCAAAFRQYIRERVKVRIDGIDDTDGFIAETVDEKSGYTDEVMSFGNLLAIRGYDLKIEWDAAHKDEAGLWFDDGQGLRTKAKIIALNEPKTLKVIVPATLKVEGKYTLQIVTQSSAKHSAVLLKNIREVRSTFELMALPS